MTRGAWAITAVLAFVVLGCSRPGPEERLRDRLGDAAIPEVLDFDYRPEGTTVTSCFRPNTAFSGTIDFATETVVLQRGDAPLAVITPEAAIVRSDLFAQPPTATWTRIPKDLDGAELDAVQAALGAEFVSYLLRDAPATPDEVPAAALDVASEVTETGTDSDTTYIVTVDSTELDRLAARAGVTTTEPTEPVDLAVVVTFRGDSIGRVTVDPGSAAGRPAIEDQEAPVGWTTTYRPATRSTPLPETRDITEPDPAALRTLRAAQITTCQVRP